MALTPQEELEEMQRRLAALDDGQQPEVTTDEAASITVPGGPPSAATPEAAQVNIPTAVPGDMPPPPPPPPPVPEGLDDLQGQVSQFASDWLSQSNPYLTPAVEAQRSAGEARLGEAEAQGLRDIDEWASSRNLVGSSLEGEQRKRLTEGLQRERGQQEADLLQMMANADLLGRQSAGAFGLDTVRAEDVMGLDRYRASLDAAQLAEAQRQFGGTLGIREQELAQQQGQFESTMNQREAEFARQFGLNEQEFAAGQERFSKQFGEQVATRLQQDEQFRLTLEDAQSARSIDTGLRQRALDLQEQGLNMEDAFRQASLDQERELTQAAQELQRLGLEKEDAYRYAALSQDKEFQTRAFDLQQQGMDLDEAYRRAELEQRDTQFQQELAFRQEQATTEQERFDAMLELLQKYYGKELGDAGFPSGFFPGFGDPNQGTGITIDRGI